MATSGSYETKINNGVAVVGTRAYGKFEWERTSYSHNDNTSTISWRVYVSEEWGVITPSYQKHVVVEINGVTSVLVGKCSDSKAGQYMHILSGTSVIPHNIDGSKTFTYKVTIAKTNNVANSWNDSRIEYYNAFSSSGTLDQLLGAHATIIGAPNFTDEENPRFIYFNPQGNNVESLQACIALYDSTDKEWHPTGAPYREIGKTDGDYTFTLTDTERKALRQAVTWGNTVNVRFYIRTTLGGQYFFSSITKTLTLVNHAPMLSPVIRDVNIQSMMLTNDTSKIIKYFNHVTVDLRAEAKKEAVLTSQTVTCGNQTKSSTGTASLVTDFDNLESSTFECSIRDSRGLRETTTVTLDLIEYFKPTCSFEMKPASTDGSMEISAHGTFFNDYFGDAKIAQKNSLTIQYRVKANEDAFGSWVAVPAAEITIDGNDYEFDYTITGLDYLNTYTVEVKVNDRVGFYPATRSQTRKTASIFDWGHEDFNFNVDVNFSDEAHFNNAANFNKSIKTAHNSIIYGKNTNGEDVIAMKTCNTNNNLILGYGNWDKGLGGTNVYGNTVNVMTKNDFKINNEKSLLGLYNAMTSSYGFATATGNMTVTAGPNYTSIVNANAILVGNQIRLMLTANRSSAVNGDIANEKVATITINHGEKIAAFFNTSFGNGGAGGVASFYTTSATMPTANTLQFDIMLAAATPSSSQFSIIATLPIAINPEYYV